MTIFCRNVRRVFLLRATLCVRSSEVDICVLLKTDDSFRLRNDLFCVGCGVKLYSLTHSQKEIFFRARVQNGVPRKLRSTTTALT